MSEPKWDTVKTFIFLVAIHVFKQDLKSVGFFDAANGQRSLPTIVNADIFTYEIFRVPEIASLLHLSYRSHNTV